MVSFRETFVMDYQRKCTHPLPSIAGWRGTNARGNKKRRERGGAGVQSFHHRKMLAGARPGILRGAGTRFRVLRDHGGPWHNGAPTAMDK